MGSSERFKTSVAHRQVVETPRGYQLVVGTEGACRRGVGEIEIEVDDVVAGHRGGAVELFDDEVDEHIAALQLVVDEAKDGQHVFLPVELDAVVDLAVEVDGEVANLHQRAADVYQMSDGREGVFVARNYSSGNGERTVHPSREDGASVDLGIEPYDAALARHLSVGLDAEGRRVAMGAYHVETLVGKRLATYAEGVDGRVVLGDEEAVAGAHVAQRAGGVNAAETVGFQLMGDVAHRKKVDGRCVQKV